MNRGPIGKGFKRARDINSTYSLFDRSFQIIGWLAPGAAAGTFAGWALSKVDWFWGQYGVVGVVLASIALGTVLIALQLVAEFKMLSLSSASPSVEGTVAPIVAGLPIKSENARSPAHSPIARSAIVVAGNQHFSPQYRVEFDRNGRDAEVWLRYCTHLSGIGRGVGWTTPSTIKLCNIERFIKGESFTAPIIYSIETSEGLRWAFGSSPDLAENGFPKYMLGPNRHYRGAIMLIGPDEHVEWCFFVVEAKSIDVMPEVLGEHMWAHVYEWAGQQPPNRDPERLFR